MKREYVKPEAEMMKFIETEEIMTASIEGIPGLTGELGVGGKFSDSWY
ncbi:MAG: hypothetical protein IKA09_07170 [Lachnospiraceae bacterium]|nr:hypothetical protein [Lachnospiraceae bacterium]